MGPESVFRLRWARSAALAVVAVSVVAIPAPAPRAATSASPEGITPPRDRPHPGWVGGDCGGCHETLGSWSHPIGIVPSMAVPPQLPLQDGRLVCTTCHDNRSSADHARARRLDRPLLRDIGPDGLCAGCHDPAATSRRDLHATMLGRAHLMWPGALEPSAWNAQRPPAAVSGRRGAPSSPDVASRVCLGCHDGSVELGGSRSLEPTRAPEWGGSSLPRARAHAPIGASHPIGMLYGIMPGPPLRPLESLDHRIRLFEGRVGCGSCHSPYAMDEALLVIPNQGSRLCLSCHVY